MSFPIDNKFRILKSETSQTDNLIITNNGSMSVDSIKESTTNSDLTISTIGTGKVKIGLTKFPSTSGTSGQVLQNNGNNELTWSSNVVDTNSPQVFTNKTIAYGSNTLTDVVSTNTDQTITAIKKNTSGWTTDISTGFLSVREANNNFFVHTLSYDAPTATLLLATSDNSIVHTGFSVGYKTGDTKIGATNYKYKLTYNSNPDTTAIDLENVRFLSVNNAKHNLSNINSIILDSGASKQATLMIDSNQLAQNNKVYMPRNTDVELRFLEGLTGSTIQTQLNTKIDETSNQNISGTKSFVKSVNNTDNFIITNPIGTINGFSIDNAFSPNKIRILKNQDDLTFVIANIERARLSGNDFDLTNGGVYKMNGTELKNVGEILTNKTISFANNTLTNVMSTNTDQIITSKKTFSNAEPLVLTNAVESKISFSGMTNNYSIKMSSSGYVFYDETGAVNLMTINNSGGVNVTALGGLKVNGDNVYIKRNTSTSAPTSSNDSSQGYSIGSEWYRTTTKCLYKAEDVSVGGAVWKNLNHQNLTFKYHLSTSLTYDPYLYIMAGPYYYNRVHVITFGDGDHRVEVYNISAASVIAESSIISAGGPQLTTIILGSPLRFTEQVTLRFSVKVVTGTNCAVFATSTE